jgi:hypothetical protein
MGLYPDLSRNKFNASFALSAQNYVPFCVGNVFREKGYHTMAFHNYYGDYFSRDLSHPNMGFDCYFADAGMEFTTDWPSSDLEMIEASIDDYIDSEGPFHAYYMTFSGHYQYNWHNAMSAKNRDRVQGLDNIETVKAYIACNLELEDAMAYLLDRLEQAGKLDKTLIVLTNDHYPYGLKAKEYNDLAGEKIDTHFEKYHNCFICYTASMEEPVVVDDYCCTADILPTVLNLLGVEYDSRLLAGTDVLSDAPHVALLETGSFLTKDFRYDADSGEITPHAEGTEISGEELDRWSALVNMKLDISREILNNDYYAHVFSQSGKDQQITENKVFDDIDEIFAQSSAAWVVERGFMDPITDRIFGAEQFVTLGEALEGWYRIAGSPETSPDFLPEGYAEARNDPARLAETPEDLRLPVPVAFDETYPYYDAVCWAFETGMLRPDDRITGHDDPIQYFTAAIQIYRFCLLNGIEIDPPAIVVNKKGKEYDRLAEVREKVPDVTEEEIIASAWAQDEHIINMNNRLYKQIQESMQWLPRGRIVSYFFRTCTYELGMN